MGTKFKEAGRPPGSPNKKSQYQRTASLNIRVTEGFENTLQWLISEEIYKSKSDVLHDALQQLAYKKVTDKKALLWISKIQ